MPNQAVQASVDLLSNLGFVRHNGDGGAEPGWIHPSFICQRCLLADQPCILPRVYLCYPASGGGLKPWACNACAKVHETCSIAGKLSARRYYLNKGRWMAVDKGKPHPKQCQDLWAMQFDGGHVNQTDQRHNGEDADHATGLQDGLDLEKGRTAGHEALLKNDAQDGKEDDAFEEDLHLTVDVPLPSPQPEHLGAEAPSHLYERPIQKPTGDIDDESAPLFNTVNIQDRSTALASVLLTCEQGIDQLKEVRAKLKRMRDEEVHDDQQAEVLAQTKEKAAEYRRERDIAQAQVIELKKRVLAVERDRAFWKREAELQSSRADHAIEYVRRMGQYHAGAD